MILKLLLMIPKCVLDAEQLSLRQIFQVFYLRFKFLNEEKALQTNNRVVQKK